MPNIDLGHTGLTWLIFPFIRHLTETKKSTEAQT